MVQLIRKSIGMTILLALVLCGVYPAVVTVLGQSVLGQKAAGSLVYKDGKVVGSHLIGQHFDSPKYFHSRPSAMERPKAGSNEAVVISSSASNLGPTSKVLAQRLADTAVTLRQTHGARNAQGTPEVLPVDMLTTSGSGLDPHITPAGALLQVQHVAASRGLDPEKVRLLVNAHIQGPEWGVFGESRVEVLSLNLALDNLK